MKMKAAHIRNTVLIPKASDKIGVPIPMNEDVTHWQERAIPIPEAGKISLKYTKSVDPLPIAKLRI